MRAILTLLLITVALPLHAKTKNDAERTASEVRDRTGTDILWQRDEAARAEAADVVRRLLKKPLTVSSAVQIALLNSRKLQATFEEIGVARADVLEAVTIPNPSIDFEVQFPFTPDTLNRYAWLVAQEFVQIVMIPLKKKVSEEALEAAQLRVAAEVLDLVADVKREYFAAQAEQQLLGRLKVIQETTSTSLELSQKQFKAGNITELALLQMQSTYSEGRLDIQQSQTELDEHREELNKLLGLWGAQTDWEIEGDLPMPRQESFSTRRLEALAVAQRLDLQATHREMTSLVSALGLTKTFRWVPVLDFGFTGERDVDGALNMGPQFRLEVPIFNQGQARVAKGQAQLRRAAANFENLAVDIRADTRKFSRRLADLGERSMFYHDVLLPARIRIVNQSILQYNAMQISPFELFTAKAEELRVERAYIDALREYWITRAELEKAVGGSLNPRSSTDKKVIPTRKK